MIHTENGGLCSQKHDFIMHRRGGQAEHLPRLPRELGQSQAQVRLRVPQRVGSGVEGRAGPRAGAVVGPGRRADAAHVCALPAELGQPQAQVRMRVLERLGQGEAARRHGPAGVGVLRRAPGAAALSSMERSLVGPSRAQFHPRDSKQADNITFHPEKFDSSFN